MPMSEEAKAKMRATRRANQKKRQALTAYHAPKANAIDVAEPGTRHCVLYTDGETFKIKRGYSAQVTLTKEEMRKALIFFAPYFSGHDFGPVGDDWEDG